MVVFMNAAEELFAALSYYADAHDWYYTQGPGANSDNAAIIAEIYCRKQTEEDLEKPYHLRTIECTEDEAYAARDRWMDDKVSPDIEPGKPFITRDPETGREIVIYSNPYITDELIFERYNDMKQY